MKTFKDTKYGDLTGKTYEGNIRIKSLPIESLKGAPEIVDGKFICSWCDKLETLKGAPMIVEVTFSCAYCENLETLDGSPKTVKGDFKCYNCNKLKDLKGSPEIVEGEFDCSYCANLETLEGAPKKCKKFICEGCSKLTSLDPLLLCEIEELKADPKLLKDYNKKKKVVDKHGYDKAMEVFEMLDDLI